MGVIGEAYVLARHRDRAVVVVVVVWVKMWMGEVDGSAAFLYNTGEGCECG